MLHGQCKNCARTTWLNDDWLCNKCSKKINKNNNYNYKAEIQNLIKRYINKINWLEDKKNDENYSYYKGMIMGLETAIHDLEDMMNEISM